MTRGPDGRIPFLFPYDPDYPCGDGRRVPDDPRRAHVLEALHMGFRAWFRCHTDVVLADALMWYPVEGRGDVRTAPDLLFAFGRPIARRYSYLQWLEGGEPPQVVLDVWATSATADERQAKFDFYQRHGVDECVGYDPHAGRLDVWVRDGHRLRRVDAADGWTSRWLRASFSLLGADLRVVREDGDPLRTYDECLSRWSTVNHPAPTAVLRPAPVDQYHRERVRAEKLAAKLRELGIDPETL